MGPEGRADATAGKAGAIASTDGIGSRVAVVVGSSRNSIVNGAEEEMYQRRDFRPSNLMQRGQTREDIIIVYQKKIVTCHHKGYVMLG